MKRYCFLAVISGCAWALIAYALSFGTFGPLVGGGLAASPLIGLIVGLVFLPAYKLPKCFVHGIGVVWIGGGYL